MNFERWEPVYEAILADMGYDRHADQHARDVLCSLVGKAATLDVSDHSLDGKTAAIAAPGPTLTADDVRLQQADWVLAAGSAADRLQAMGVAPDWVVTDLDGHGLSIREFVAAGSRVAVHAHGDNVDRLESHLSTGPFDSILPTTQAEPVGPVSNLGGFTDGDRAAFLASALGADRLTFPGWDLDDQSVSPEKRQKLVWAARLLLWLERCRGDSFDVLDGRRDTIDDSVLPDEG